jgi:Cu+-exporting ATPase
MLVVSSLDGLTAAAPATCRHCGDPCATADAVLTVDGAFCCHGCETVFSILKAHELDGFYACDLAPGLSQKDVAVRGRGRFAALEDPAVAARLIVFDDGRGARASFQVPAIHCASCVWLLERLWKLDPGVVRTEVDLLRRTVVVDYVPASTSLRHIAERLADLGYEPAITVEDAVAAAPAARRRLYLQLGVAGFAFGNMMLFSIPRYANGAPLPSGFQRMFDALNLLFALPVLLFSASDFFRSAWNTLRTRTMALDVPIALGLLALFGRSVADITLGRGEGFLDSFAGLVFFLLVARLFQQKMFERIAFDRTYRSFLPLTVRVERDGVLTPVPLEQVRAGDCMAVRAREIVPADAVLLDAPGAVDYAFTTGESTPVLAAAGDIVRAGGRAAGATMRLRAVREVSHSDLARLWQNPVFARPKRRWLADVNATFGAWFTGGAIVLALCGAAAWWPDAAAATSVATAVLIIACPCALTMSAPITLGTAAALLGRRGLFLKDPAVALDLSRIDTVAFDKTGTLTSAAAKPAIEIHGIGGQAWPLVRALAAVSAHPISRAIAAAECAADTNAADADAAESADYRRARATGVLEVGGRGVSGTVGTAWVAIGSAAFIEAQTGTQPDGPADATFVVAAGEHGWVRVAATARPGVEDAARTLSDEHDVFLISGDHHGERSRWERLFGPRMRFRQSPDDKLSFVRAARDAGRTVLMIGDGLNDAGALAAADVGMAVSDETACMAPACDAVIDGRNLSELPRFLRFARRARQVVVLCFLVSIVYNAVGLTLALRGALTPLAAAILMPLSSLTIVGLGAGTMRWSAKRMLPS